MQYYDLVIAGGGAAGFFAAINYKQRCPSAGVLIVEKSNKLLAKVKVSGGGRCNVTHACYEKGLLVKNYPRGEKALYSSFSRFAVEEVIAWFGERGVELKTEEDGRMFPVSNTSQSIIDCFLREAGNRDICIRTNTEIVEIEKAAYFIVRTKDGDAINAKQLLIATGGHPKIGAYSWMEKLGHRIIPPVPSLFTFNIPNHPITKLMGIAVTDARIKVTATKLESEGPLLITHWGMSGPAVLKLSAWGARMLNEMNYHFDIRVDWLGKLSQQEVGDQLMQLRREKGNKQVSTWNPFEFPSRLWHYLLEQAVIEKQLNWADLSKKQLNALINVLTNNEYKVSGKTTFKEEFVTCGGIDLKEIDFKTMESKICKGLYFAGEVLDIDGVTGGFNFQNAWTTAWVAAEAMK